MEGTNSGLGGRSDRCVQQSAIQTADGTPRAIWCQLGAHKRARSILFLLYQSVILSVVDCGLGLTTLSQSNLLKLDRVQNEAMRVILGTTKGTPIETMRY